MLAIKLVLWKGLGWLNLFLYSVLTMSPCHTLSGSSVFPSPTYLLTKKPLATVDGLLASFMVLSISRFLAEAAYLVLGLNLVSGLVKVSLAIVVHFASLIAG